MLRKQLRKFIKMISMTKLNAMEMNVKENKTET